jgi:hypothetical protein
MAQGNARDPKLERVWRRHLRRQLASGVTVRDYCLEYELRESAFYFWRREIAERDRACAEVELAMASGQSAPAFLPVTVVEAPAPTPTAVDIRLSNGHRLRVRAGCDRQLLADVVAVLEGKSC